MRTYLLLFLIFSLLLSFSSGEQCGHQAGGALCPNGLCCSEAGWCGNTETYCGSGCQRQCNLGPYPPTPSTPPAPTPTEQCGRQAEGALCPNGLCCSKDGYCGTTEPYCGHGCQSQCTPPPPSPPPPSPTPPNPTRDISDIISRYVYYDLLLNANDTDSCADRGFFTYDAFITATRSFPSFGNTGDLATRKKEIAAFFGQTAHETAAESERGLPFCVKEERNTSSDYSDTQNAQWPCAPGQRYYGRGPFMLSWNYNYGSCGIDIGVDLLKNPSLASNDSVISFKTAIWFWMTPQAPKPSCHDVITDQWQPSDADIAAGRLPGYGVITNIIDGELECAGRSYEQQDNRLVFYLLYCELLGVDYGSNIDCDNQRPFSEGSSVFLDAAI